MNPSRCSRLRCHRPNWCYRPVELPLRFGFGCERLRILFDVFDGGIAIGWCFAGVQHRKARFGVKDERFATVTLLEGGLLLPSVMFKVTR